MTSLSEARLDLRGGIEPGVILAGCRVAQAGAAGERKSRERPKRARHPAARQRDRPCLELRRELILSSDAALFR